MKTTLLDSSNITSLSESKHTFTTWDGAELFYRAWLPEFFDKAVILFHRGHEHSGRWQELVEALNFSDTAVFAWDARGHGNSPGERGYAENFNAVIKDIDTFVNFISQKYELSFENLVVLAHSVAAVGVSAWVHDYAPRIRGMILATPAFQVKLYVPLAIPALRLLNRIKKRSFIKSYVGGKLLTHDSEQAQAYDKDPKISRSIATNILLDLFETSSRIVADAEAIRTPTLLLVAGSDQVVHATPQREFFRNLSSATKELIVYDGFYHSIFHEKDRCWAFAHVREFIARLFENDEVSSDVCLLKADHLGYTKSEFDKLSQPLPKSCLRNLAFKIQKVAMKTAGRLSRGIQIGWQTGFDSGQSLDYVYENRPRGITPIGRWIDRAYLNSIGWRGIRQRKENLQKILCATIDEVSATQKSVHVVDIAAGPGRYLLETIKRCPQRNISALLRDRNEQGLAAGRKLAAEMKLDRVKFQSGDAFDRQSLEMMSPRPDITIVSGLYELFSDNQMVLNSLHGLAEALPENGYLIYTNQPWHPQVEMIARVLTNRDGKPWIMRRRTQAEMDELVQKAGFEKIKMEIDPFGIFTVSIARRKS